MPERKIFPEETKNSTETGSESQESDQKKKNKKLWKGGAFLRSTVRVYH